MYVPNLTFTWTLRNNFSHFQKGPQKKSSRVLDPLNFTWTPRNYFFALSKGSAKIFMDPKNFRASATPDDHANWSWRSCIALLEQSSETRTAH